MTCNFSPTNKQQNKTQLSQLFARQTGTWSSALQLLPQEHTHVLQTPNSKLQTHRVRALGRLACLDARPASLCGLASADSQTQVALGLGRPLGLGQAALAHPQTQTQTRPHRDHSEAWLLAFCRQPAMAPDQGRHVLSQTWRARNEFIDARVWWRETQTRGDRFIPQQAAHLKLSYNHNAAS